MSPRKRGISLVAEAEEGYCFAEPITDVCTIADVSAATTSITINDDYSITANLMSSFAPMSVAGGFHTVGLKSDGTVVATGCTGGFGDYGQCNVGGWMLK